MLQTYSDLPGCAWDTDSCQWIRPREEKPKKKEFYEFKPLMGYYKFPTYKENLHSIWKIIRSIPDWVKYLKNADYEQEDIEFILELERLKGKINAKKLV